MNIKVVFCFLRDLLFWFYAISVVYFLVTASAIDKPFNFISGIH